MTSCILEAAVPVTLPPFERTATFRSGDSRDQANGMKPSEAFFFPPPRGLVNSSLDLASSPQAAETGVILLLPLLPVLEASSFRRIFPATDFSRGIRGNFTNPTAVLYVIKSVPVLESLEFFADTSAEKRRSASPR